MKSSIFFVLCILTFASPQEAGHMKLRSDSAISSPTRIQETRPSHPTVSKSRAEKVSTSSSTLRSSMRNQKTAPSGETIPKSSGKVPSTYRSHSSIGSQSRSLKKLPSDTAVQKSNGKVPTGDPTIRSKTPVSPTIRATSQKPKLPSPHPPPTETPKSSPPPTTAINLNLTTTTSKSSALPAITTAKLNSTTTPKSSSPSATTSTASNSKTNQIPVASKLVTATKTLTVSNGQTASAQVGWIVVGVGVGGSVAVGGNTLPVAGGTEGVIVANGSGQDKIDPINTSTTLTTSSTTSSTTRSTSSSTSSTARPTPYNIYPKPDSTPPERSAFARKLEQIALPGSVKSITGVRDKLLLWVANLTPAQASEISRDLVVRGLNVDKTIPFNLERASGSDIPPTTNCPPENCSHQKRDGNIMLQITRHDELKMFSQARGASLSQVPGYAFDSMGGQGITVYVIDTGINPNHPEFRNMQGGLRWLFLPIGPQNQGDEDGHGTCVASKVTGQTYGVAKRANLVIVKLPGRTITMSQWIAAFAVVAGDISLRNLEGRSVVCSTQSVDPNALTDDDEDTFIGSVGDLIDLNAALVVASSNRDVDSPEYGLATYPALLGSQFPIVVVGGVETSGIYYRDSQGLAAELTVSAAARVLCASGSETATNYEGTSFGEPLSGYISLAFDDIGRGNLATPAVAGLAAYFMSLDRYRVQIQAQGHVARNVRDLIKSLAYARLPLQPAVVWNGIDSRNYFCPMVRRDAGSTECPAQNTTIVYPAHGTTPGQSPKVTLTSSSSSPPPSMSSSLFSTTTGPPTAKIPSASIVTGLSATPGSFNPLPSGIRTILPTAIYESGSSLIIPLTTVIR